MGNKRQFGECRCCLSRGSHRSLIKEYYIQGNRVLYRENILQCFKIFLSLDPKLSTLICDSCISCLRQACSFRTLILKTQRQLNTQGNLNETEFVNVLLQPNTSIEDDSVFIKQETESCDSSSLTFDYDQCELDSQNLVPGESALLERFASGSLRPLPTRESLINMCPIFYGHLESLKDKVINADMIQATKPEKKRKEKKINRKNYDDVSQKMAQAMNASTLLENSNATAFKSKMRSGFPCFYCRDIFVNPKSLREHQIIHPKSHLFKLLTKYTANALIVYADTTDLKCNICNKDVPSLDDLKRHLIDQHDKKFYEDYSDRVIPFRLADKENNFECQLCARSFETFGATDRHMNEHFNNYVCEECGSGFITKHRLKVHTYLLHSKKTGAIKCDPCKKVFATKNKYKIHYEYVHKKLKKLQCSQCDEKFVDYFSRQRHMEEVHNAAVLSYKCKLCNKTFNRKYGLTCHVRRIHLAKKDVQCELCPFMCFNKSELRDHMFKHGGEKGFECKFCQKSFARKKTLTVHMKVHNKDKCFTCHFCGEVFVSNSSLKTHLKTHTSDYVNL